MFDVEGGEFGGLHQERKEEVNDPAHHQATCDLPEGPGVRALALWLQCISNCQ